MGLVVSVKIGGGNNLHNMDMFLVSLVLLGGMSLGGRDIHRFHREKNNEPGASLEDEQWPLSIRLAAILAVLIPSWAVVRTGQRLELPDRRVTEQAVQLIASKAERLLKSGEVLFLDQRQLLTFGAVRGIPLVTDYEKKYMMDQAMAGNAGYFKTFYTDLAEHRFALIVSEPLFTNLQGDEYGFQEENNAWVRWVAGPLLCYYAPLQTIPEVRVQLLVPRAQPQGCP
jgi:hypothetical protein